MSLNVNSTTYRDHVSAETHKKGVLADLHNVMRDIRLTLDTGGFPDGFRIGCDEGKWKVMMKWTVQLKPDPDWFVDHILGGNPHAHN